MALALMVGLAMQQPTGVDLEIDLLQQKVDLLKTKLDLLKDQEMSAHEEV